jgi:hypothetical protein
MRVRTVLPLVALALAACTGGSAATTTTSLPPTVTTTSQGSPSASGVDPLVPYSPPTTPFEERTSGFVPDTLTAPTNGGGKLFLTPVTTTMTTAYVHETRALAVYLTIENPGDQAWSGTVGAHAQITDATGGVFPAEQPARGDLHPDPGRYGGANRNLLRPVTIQAGQKTKGVLVFHPTGGNRAITLRISVDGGATWVEWATNLGVF